MPTRTLPVFGMTCASCALSVEKTLAKQKGVAQATVNLAGKTALIEYQETIDFNALKRAVLAAGYDIDISDNKSAEEIEALHRAEFQKLSRYALLAFIFSVPVFVFGMFFHHSEAGKWISMLLSAVSVFGFGHKFFVNAYKQFSHGKANMDTLVALSTGTAYVFSAYNTLFPQTLLSRGLQPEVYFESAAVITAFILLGKWMEEKAKTNTSAAIKQLMGLQPKTVRVLRHQTETDIAIEQVQQGELLLIRPGEKIPVDGTVTEGSTFIDESTITGEPVPVQKLTGAKVFAGTINQKGSITIQAQKVGKETLLAQIIQTVQQAQGSKAPVQKMVDKIAGIFVPVVISIAILTLAVWLLAGGKNYLLHGFVSAVSVLVIACPCALGLATPTAIMVGLGCGAQHGILIRNAQAIEQARHLDLIVLDKTGTITKGKPEVSCLHWVQPNFETQYAAVLAAIEAKSEHPLAEAVVKYLQVKNNTVQIENFESLTGKGAFAQTQQAKFWVGSERLMKEKLIWLTPEDEALAAEHAAQGSSVIFFSSDKNLLAIIALADAVKESSAPAIAQLQKHHEVVMLTGDNKATAQAVAARVGITRYLAGTLPADKAKFIAQEKLKGKMVAMVGDGINDSEALAIADIGMAMGKGTDIAMHIADITLMHSTLDSIPKAIRLSQLIVRTIRQNLFWAFIYNVIGIPLAAGLLYPFTGFQLSPMVAGAAMALSSVSVVSNSLWLTKKKIN